MTQPDYPEGALHDQYWYAKPFDDEGTSWTIQTVNQDIVSLPPDVIVSAFMTRFSAKYIAKLHNQALHERRQREDPEHDRSSCYCCCFDCPEDLDE